MPIEVNVVNIEVAARVFAQFDEGAFQLILAQIAAAARDKWIQVAARDLASSRKDYIDGIQEVQLKGNMAVVALVGQFPNMIEHGWDGGDMRDWMLSEEAPHQDTIRTNQQGGRYRVIPFRHQTPGTRGTAGTPMGGAYGPNRPGSLRGEHAVIEKHKALGRRVHRAVKKLEAGVPLRTSGPGAHLRQPIPKLKPHHTASIYEGMVKKLQRISGPATAAGAAPTQATYVTFRTISEDNPIGWHHPGIQAHNFAGQVVAYVQRIAPRAFSAYVKGLKEGGA